MNDENEKIIDINIEEVRVLNPRSRSKRTFLELIASIRKLGLKKPITVCQRKDASGYDLICGQGRLEAFKEIGEKKIPAIVAAADTEECFVRSLVENLARRQTGALEFMREIVELRAQNYSVAQVAAKTGCTEIYVSAVDYLHSHGEERLLQAVDRGVIPPAIAIEISHAKEDDVQRALAEAYENKLMPGNQVMAIRKIIAQRNTFGKDIQPLGARIAKPPRRVTAQILVRAFERETKKQRLMIRKAGLAQAKLLYISNAFKKLLSDKAFVELLLINSIESLPKPLAERVGIEVLS